MTQVFEQRAAEARDDAAVLGKFNARFRALEAARQRHNAQDARVINERVEMTRAQVDEALGLTPDEFRIEGALIAIGPLVGEDTLSDLIERLENAGLVYYDDFFELSGNWPEWLRLFAMDASV